VTTGTVVWFFLGARHTTLERGIVLCGARASPPIAERWLDETLFASMALSLSEQDRTGLERVVEDANTRWEGRANPLLEDFGDGEPDDELEAWFSQAPASVLTALTASSSRFCAVDGFCVEAAMPSAPCSPGFARLSAKAERDRARFLAWPFGYAMWFRAETANDAETAADALRLRARSSKWIGLVVHAADGHRAEQPPFAELRERFVRHEALKELVTDGGAGHHGASSFPLRLDPSDVLVLPRLEALTSLGAFEAEIRQTAPSLQIVR